MKICPKCSWPSESHVECDKCGVQFGDIKKNKEKASEVDPYCAWDGAGSPCNKRGSCSESTNGSGPWYCSEHFWYGLKGWKKHPTMQSWKALYDEPAQRMREPGED